MGDRISIQFTNTTKGYAPSAILFSHCWGLSLLGVAQKYISKLKEEAALEGEGDPLYRLEPQIVMVDFIREFVCHPMHRIFNPTNPRIVSGFYLSVNTKSGDNSDNGHWVIDLDADTIQRVE